MSNNPNPVFPFHPLGYLRHWLVTGPRETPYRGPDADEFTLRRDAVDRNRITPPSSARLQAAGPLDEPWRFYYPGENIFLEHEKFHFGLTILDSYAFAEIESPQDTRREARLWVSGAVDLWVNDIHITRFEVVRYMHPDFQVVALPLRQGINRVCVRLQCLGIRDTRNLFGLQLIDASGLALHVPGAGRLIPAATWLDSVRTEGRDAVVSSVPAPVKASVESDSPLPWAEGQSFVSLGSARPFQLSVKVIVDGQPLRRSLEIPANRAGKAVEPPADVRRARLAFIAGMQTETPTLPTRKEFLALLARRLLGVKSERDSAALDVTLAFIDRRSDCADFALATLLRLEALGLADSGESARIRKTALSFRYWQDEPGSDAMCFWSENHSLLFDGCQLIAGRLYPEDVFSNSGRTGSAQAALAATRCNTWFDRIEERGLEEFNSGTYLPITAAALLNLVDFSGDAEMARRASLILDGMYEDLALHVFEGVIISPQGRVYRNVLYPEESGVQAFLADPLSDEPLDLVSFSHRSPPESWTGDWIVHPISSRNYLPPAHLKELMEKPVSKRYHQGGAEIVLHKTSAYLLTSLAIPASAPETEQGVKQLRPGKAGYQQHLWQATLGRECHVFVNHPGASFDESKSRPGYWYGNGILPRLRQREGVLQAIYNIPDGSEPHPERTQEQWNSPSFNGSPIPYDLYPIPFTHVHWPADAFDRQEKRGHWLFGQKNSGCIALWCSEVLEPHDGMLTRREFRALANRSAWVAICSGLFEHADFETFTASCVSRQPEFAALSLLMKGEEPLFWHGPG